MKGLFVGIEGFFGFW